MKKTHSISIDGLFFQVEDDAYELLDNYIGQLQNYFKLRADGTEILKDIESRISELLKTRLNKTREVVCMDDVNEVIATMGRPEDFMDPDDASAVQPDKKYAYTSKKLFRNADNRVLGGVCSGVAAYLHTKPWVIRLLAGLLIAPTSGVMLAAYFLAWIIVPPAETKAQKLEMQGEPVNIDSLGKETEGTRMAVEPRLKVRRDPVLLRILKVMVKILAVLFVTVFALPLIVALFAIAVALFALIAGVSVLPAFFTDLFPAEFFMAGSPSATGLYIMGGTLVVVIIYFFTKMMYHHKGKTGWFLLLASVVFLSGLVMTVKHGALYLKDHPERFGHLKGLDHYVDASDWDVNNFEVASQGHYAIPKSITIAVQSNKNVLVVNDTSFVFPLTVELMPVDSGTLDVGWNSSFLVEKRFKMSDLPRNPEVKGNYDAATHTLNIPEFYNSPYKARNKYDCKVILKVPVNTTITFKGNTANFVNVAFSGLSDSDMTGEVLSNKSWKMLADGLLKIE